MPWYRAYYRWHGGKRPPQYVMLAKDQRAARDWLMRTQKVSYSRGDWSLNDYTQDSGLPAIGVSSRTGRVATDGDAMMLVFVESDVTLEITEMHADIVRDLVVLGTRLGRTDDPA